MSTNQLLYKFAKPYPGWIITSILLGFSGALFNGIGVTLIVPVLLRFLGQEIDFKDSPLLVRDLGRTISAE